MSALTGKRVAIFRYLDVDQFKGSQTQNTAYTLKKQKNLVSEI